MHNIVGISEYENTDITENIVIIPPKFNRMWGADFILMDSKTFLGGIGGEGYKEVIDMFTNVWNAYNYRLFSGF